MPRPRMTHAEWLAEAARRFGPDPMNWKFICPACGHTASVADWRTAGAPESGVAFSCVGRWSGPRRDAFGFNPGELPTSGPGPCNYAGAGLFTINPIDVVLDDGSVRQAFAFAEPAPVDQADESMTVKGGA